MVDLRMELDDLGGVRVAEPSRVKRLTIRAPFGAMKAKCFADFYRTERDLPLEQGAEFRVYLEGRLKFRGEIVSVRRDSEGDELSLYAEREPELRFNEAVNGTYESMTPTAILEQIIGGLSQSPLSLIPPLASTREIDRLHFARFDLFYAIDLLAKLAGNWLWDIDWDNRLRFRSHESSADHVVYFDARRQALKVWKTAERIRNYFELYGGVVEENQFFRAFADEESIARFGARRQSLFVRPITTETAYGYLRLAVLEQAGKPVYEKYFDRDEGDLSIGVGDTLVLRGHGLRSVDEEQRFRVKMEEISVDPSGKVHTRYHLAELWESASRFLCYQDHEKGEPAEQYVARRIGSFALDFSGLDSRAHLD
jgi:hypothetical protein